MSDEIMDIADASIASERTEGDVEAKDADLLKKREHRIKARPWFLERLAHQYPPKQQMTSISQTLNVTMTPEEAMREYIKIIDEKPA